MCVRNLLPHPPESSIGGDGVLGVVSTVVEADSVVPMAIE